MMRYIALASLLVGCSYTHTPMTNMVDLTQRDWSDSRSLRSGESCQKLLFGRLPIGGTASTMTAIRKSGVKEVYLVDYAIRGNIIVTQRCTVVYGTD